MDQITAAERKRWADKLGINEQYLYQCLTGRRDMDAATAMRVEQESEGALKRQALCQGSFAAIWPDLLTSPDGHPRRRATDFPAANRA